MIQSLPLLNYFFMSRTLINSEIFVPIIQLLTNLDIYTYNYKDFLERKVIHSQRKCGRKT